MSRRLSRLNLSKTKEQKYRKKKANSSSSARQGAAMSYLHRPLPTSQQSGLANPAGTGRLADLLEFVKQEFDGISGQTESLRRENVEFAGHAEIHLNEMQGIRIQLTEMEREHARARTHYEEKIADLQRQVETLRAQNGTGPPIPAVIPASTNHFGSLMGHPHGMFGQGGQGQSQTPGSSSSANTGHAIALPGSSNGTPSNGMRLDRERERERERERDRERDRDRDRERDNRLSLDERDTLRERERERERSHLGHGELLGKRQRGDDLYDGPPHAFKNVRAGTASGLQVEGIGTRSSGPPETGIESRTSSSTAFPPRPPSRTHAHSPQSLGPTGLASASNSIVPTPSNLQSLPPSEPSVLSQPPPETKPTIHPLTPLQIPRSKASTPSNEEDKSTMNVTATNAAPSSAATPSISVAKKQPDWDVTYNQKVKKVLDVTLLHTFIHDSVVCCVRISPDGKLVATGCNRTMNVYDTNTGTRIMQLSDEPVGRTDNYIRSVAFSPDGRLIATGSEDRLIRIWDIFTRKIYKVLIGHRSEIYSLAFTPDGLYIISGSGDKTARIWSVDSGKMVHELVIDDIRMMDNGQPQDAGITSVAISLDGNLLAAGSLDHIVRIWDMQSGKLLDKLKGHKDSVYSVAFIPGEKQMVTGSLDKTLKVWDLALLKTALAENKLWDPNESKTSCLQSLAGHKDYVLSVATSADGNWVVSGSKDRAVQFWDARTGQPQFLLHGHKNSVISIAMSESGGLLATGSGDWQARIFKISGLGLSPDKGTANGAENPNTASGSGTGSGSNAGTPAPAQNGSSSMAE